MRTALVFALVSLAPMVFAILVLSVGYDRAIEKFEEIADLIWND